MIFAGIYLATQPNFYRIGAIKLCPRRGERWRRRCSNPSALRLWLKGQAIAMVVVGLTGFGLWSLGMPLRLDCSACSPECSIHPIRGTDHRAPSQRSFWRWPSVRNSRCG